MKNDQFTLRTGMLDVADGHSIWYMEWGNKEAAVPIFNVHGGPGSESKQADKSTYDPKKNRVVFFDQRGCGKSKPKNTLKDNTSQKLVDDIEQLRDHLGEDKIMLSGGSWGSTLSLLYAIAYPRRVHKMLLHGVLLGTKAEIDYKRQGVIRTHFPEAFYFYDELVPKNRKGNTVAYYFEQLQKGEGNKYEEHVRRWSVLESAASSLDDDFLTQMLNEDGRSEKKQQMALMEAYYFANNMFLADGYVLDNAYKLKDIPTVIMQGRFDHVCPPENAYKLSEAMGNNCRLHIGPSSHKKQMALREAVRAYAWAFLE